MAKEEIIPSPSDEAYAEADRKNGKAAIEATIGIVGYVASGDISYAPLNIGLTVVSVGIAVDGIRKYIPTIGTMIKETVKSRRQQHANQSDKDI